MGARQVCRGGSRVQDRQVGAAVCRDPVPGGRGWRRGKGTETEWRIESPWAPVTVQMHAGPLGAGMGVGRGEGCSEDSPRSGADWRGAAGCEVGGGRRAGEGCGADHLDLACYAAIWGL